MDDDSLKEMEQRYVSWSTEDLVRSITFERNQYEGEAIALMQNELQKRGTPQDELDAAQENVKNKIAERTRKLTGVRGILLLFIVLLVFNLLHMLGVGLAGLIYAFGNPSGVVLAQSACCLAVGAYGVYTLVLLLKKRSDAPSHTLRWIYCTLGLGALNLAAGFLVFGKIAFFTTVGPTIFSLVWLTYFTKSKRVAITYNWTE